jgi:phage tail sheath protein FI
MPEYLSPGVYVEEVDTGNKPIEGVATSTVGFLGVAERGPLTPMLVTSFTEYTRWYGSYSKTSYLTYSVEGFFQNGGKRCFVARVAGKNAGLATVAAGNLTVRAVGPGVWANNRVYIKISDCGLNNPADPNTTMLFKLTVMYWDASVNLPTPPVDPTDPTKLTDPNRREPTIVEQYDNLSPDPLSASFCERLINDISVLATVSLPGGNRPANTNALTPLVNGSAGNAIALIDFAGDPNAAPGQRTGLLALEEIDEIAILCCPDEYYANVPPGQIAGAMIDQCERLKDRFAILQAQNAAGLINNLRPTQVTKYAAFYYPWIAITDPLTDQRIEVPPGGHVAGIYARSDIERGVHKAPANEVIRGLFTDPNDPTAGLQFNITKGQQDILNPRGVNVLRYFLGRGNLVWGARTCSLDPDWKYVNVRRLFIFVEESIDEATQWVVFEPNDEPTWARVRRSVSDFLTRLWMDGMLQGRSAAQAFFVRCDRTTITQADIDNGRLIMLIGIAPVKPAEFVIFRIGQWTGGSEVSEG